MSSFQDWADTVYRPKSYDEIYGNDWAVRQFRRYTETGNFPNLLLVGPPGVGKTALAEILAKSVGAELKEWNASDDRKIKFIQGDFKDFARSKALTAKFKVGFLDECEKLSDDAEDAARRIVEKYSANCRFIMATNYVSKVEKSLKSKFHEIKFRRLMPEEIMKNLQRIRGLEGKNDMVTDEQLYAISDNAGGDMRKGIKTLQGLIEGRKIAVTDIELGELMPHPDIQKVGSMVQLALRGEYTEAVKLLEDLSFVHSQDEIYRVVEAEFLESSFTEEDKIKIGLALGQISNYSLDDKRQLYGFVALLAKRT